MRKGWAAVAAAGLLLVGCSGGCAEGDPTPAPEAEATTPAATPTPSPTPTPTPTPEPLGMGDSYRYDSDGFEVAYTDYKSVDDAEIGTIQGFRASFCLDADQPEIEVGNGAWFVANDSGGRFTAMTITGFPEFEPSYGGPTGVVAVQPGECVEGWIPFITGEELATISYAPRGLPRTTWVR